MEKYFKAQLKRLLKLFPFVLVVSLILLFSGAIAFKGIAKATLESEENKIFQIGICGDTQNEYFKVGMAALENFDSSRFTIKLTEMEESAAKEMLKKGELYAYAVIPKGFVNSVLRGNILPIKYVSNDNNVGMTTIFKNEITTAIEQLVIASQKGVFGLETALYENGNGNIAYKSINNLNIEFIDMIIGRTEMYSVEELGIASGSSFMEYFVCGLAVVLLLLIGLPYASVFIKKDYALNKLLKASNLSVGSQVAAEYFSYFLSVAGVSAVLFVLSGAGLSIFFDVGTSFADVMILFVKILPIIALTTAFGYFFDVMSGDIISGVLMQFFVSVFLCYITGCFYPLYAFPVFIQKIAPYLPTGAARDYMAGCITQNSVIIPLVILLGYTAAFFFAAKEIKKRKIGEAWKAK